MAEKKPLSLNERHNRLLKDLSSQSQPGKPHSSKPGEDNPVRVKVEGRRRLCKLASRNDDGEDGVGFDEPQFSGIADFDSPPAKNGKEGSDSDVNEIRDILNDLSSRLEILSIGKKRIPKAAELEPCGDSHVPCTDEAANLPGEKADALGYTSAASSFSLSPDKFDSSSDTALQTRVSTESESEGDNFIGKDKASKGERKYDAIGVNKMPVSIGHSFVSSDDHDDDDCVVLSSNELGKEAQRRDPNFKELIDVSEADVLEEPPNDSVSEEDESIILRGTKSTYRLPGKIAKMLYPHQRDGLKWLWSIHCRQTGGILGDDMGLGKTMQICGFLAGLFHSCLIKRVLVVAPKTLLSHWIKELSVVGLAEKTREYFGSCMKTRQYELQYVLQDKGVLLTTYDIVRTSSKSLCGDYYLHDDRSEDGITWDYIILDEGHLIKNPSTQRAKSLLEIPSGHRIIISGTPIQNNLKELWALFNFCCPELLGDKKEFKERYESPILHANDKNASDREKRIGSMVAKELRKRIEPYFLRRLKSEIFNENESVKGTKLSKKNEIIVWLRLTQCQRQLYEAFLNSELVLSAFDGSPLAALTILKKICDHPYLLTKRAAEDVLEGMDSLLNQEDLGVAENLALHLSNATSSEDSQELHGNVSCKISFILSLLGNLIPEGHHVLIFSQTRKMLNLIQEAISLRGYQFLRIDGTTKASDRQIIVNDFQEGRGASIFLLTSQVGGLGLTLTRADRVIVVDPAWNPSTDNQSVDRAYRIGQEKDVIVYRLMTCGTIEEKIYKMQVFKGGLFKTATEHKEQTRYFSQRDLGELFSLPKQGFDVSLTQQQLREEHDSQHTMDETLKNHINFLESEGVAGVSHHNLLFSKTAPAPIPLEEDEILRQKGNKFVGSSSSCASREHYVDGAEYAFNPKNVKLLQRNTTTGSTAKLKELEIKERIERLSLTLENKATISKLPDKGERIRRQIAELNLELDKIRVAEGDEKQVIDLDDISVDLERVLIV